MKTKTEVLKVNPADPEPELIARAAEALLAGRLVVFPTETVYGLGANALNAAAVQGIFAAKVRPFADPLIVHLASADEIGRVAHSAPDFVPALAAAFWPGALTLILPKNPAVPGTVTANLSTVAVRVPAHPVALALLRQAAVPVAAPSANRFGRTSPTTAAHVLADLMGRVHLVLDSGPTPLGVESTVLDVTRTPPVILRPGGVTREALELILGEVRLLSPSAAEGDALVSPGLLDKHYAPHAEFVLCLALPQAQALSTLRTLAQQELDAGRRVGLLLADEDQPAFAGLDVEIYRLGAADDLETIARRLYAGLRALDELGVEVILGRDFGSRGLGLAIRDRLRRAASRVIGQAD